VYARWSDASWGDLRPQGDDAAALAAAMSTCSPGGQRCTLHHVEQVHGSAVVVLRGPGSEGPGPARARCAGVADALVTGSPANGLAVLVADCAPLALASPEGIFGAVHAGWRGVSEGVVEHAVAAMRELGASSVTGVRGPCIRACCYEFSTADLDGVVARYGPSVRGRATSGAAALDLPAAVSAALDAAGAAEGGGVDECTACGEGYFSHRARRDRGRQALLVWRTEEPAAA
jgi:purine-nucleoside/S-methyl-5'-thioadenosine phosphorylase / adenosine deaminase